MTLYLAARTYGQPGSIDPSFNGIGGPDQAVLCLALQPDAKIIVGGNFTTINGTRRNSIARFHADGTLDESFDPGEGANSAVHSVAVQDDGKIVIGGSFTQLRGQTRNRIGRLNANGTLDSEFDPPGGMNSDVYAINVLPDGTLLVGGAFTQANGVARGYFARLKASGTLDNAFAAEANAAVRTVALRSDDKILLGGDFTNVGGQLRNYVARLNANGSVDLSFDPAAGPNGAVYDLALQPDGKVVIGGAFSAVNEIGYTY
ncbi:MAG: hypothetical protein L0Z50_20980, partial [Verrucomicrobiales bacterium]|nr:hypothetical protein [Verrucomicrobiales bacterium]